MRRWLLLPIVLVGVVLLVSAQTTEPDETTQTLKSGETVTKALRTVTSTAISPLLGGEGLTHPNTNRDSAAGPLESPPVNDSVAAAVDRSQTACTHREDSPRG